MSSYILQGHHPFNIVVVPEVKGFRPVFVQLAQSESYAATISCLCTLPTTWLCCGWPTLLSCLPCVRCRPVENIKRIVALLWYLPNIFRSKFSWIICSACPELFRLELVAQLFFMSKLVDHCTLVWTIVNNGILVYQFVLNCMQHFSVLIDVVSNTRRLCSNSSSGRTRLCYESRLSNAINWFNCFHA